MQLRQDVAAFVGAELAWLTLCPAIPRVFDHLDQGIMARAVIVAANVLDRSGPQRDPRVPYLLDMRPICCGMTWGLARHGRLWIHPIVTDAMPSAMPATVHNLAANRSSRPTMDTLPLTLGPSSMSTLFPPP